MAETSAGGWVRNAERSSASTRPWACASGAASAAKGAASRNTKASACATGINATARSPMLSLSWGSVAPRFAAAFFDQPNALDAHAALDRLHHVIDGEAGDRYRRQRFHLDTGLTGHMDGGAHDEARQLAVRFDLHRDLGNRDGMAQGNELVGPFPRHDAGNARS